MKHRSRSRTLWNDAEPRLKRPDGDGDADGTSAAHREAIEELRKLREKAEKARGKKSITTRFHDAKVAEAWGKSLKAQLPQPVEGAALATRVLGEMWRCASQPVRRTIAPRSVVRSPADVFEANKKPPSMDQGCAEPRDSSSHDRMKLPRDAAFADGEPFAYIDDDAYDRAASLYEASKRAGVAVGPAPLNPEQRDGGRDFLQVAQLRRATAQRGEPIQCIRQALEQSGVTLVVGAGGTGKSAMVKRLQEQFAARDCGRLVVTAYTGVAAAPFGGPTLLSLLNMRINTKAAKRISCLNQADITKLRKKFESESGVKVDELGGIVIDEVSFTEAQVFGHLDARLRCLTGHMDVICGGIPILLVRHQGITFRTSSLDGHPVPACYH
jgi:hypothetical protein